MSKAVLIAGLGVLSSVAGSASANDLAWYDPTRQAIAIDTYAYGYGRTIDIDFNADHSAAGVIDQSVWTELYGATTRGGLFRTTDYPDGSELTVFGWGDALGDLAPASNFSSEVVSFYDGSAAPEGFHYFAPAWDVASGKTVVYVQPIVSAAAVPVTEDMLANIFARYDEGDWYAFDQVPNPNPIQPVAASLTISPSVLNRKSQGRWVTAQIQLPSPYTVDDLDIDSVSLTISSKVMVDGSPADGIAISRKVTAAAAHGTKLLAKFDRSALLDLLVSGDSTVYVAGRLRDGTPIQGSTTLTVTH